MSWDDFTDKFSSVGEGFGKFAKRLFGSENEREIRRLTPIIEEINGLESWAQGLDREAFPAEVAAMRAMVDKGEATLDDVLTKMFALTREASQRTLGMRHYDVQLVGGYVLHQGKIAEMMTGEGKTLDGHAARWRSTPSAADRATSSRSTTTWPVVTRTGCDRSSSTWDCPSVRSSPGLDANSRKPIYACDIVYGTNNEFGFDYLRDNMKTSRDQQVQKDLYFAIVDEVDSILIDEARTPLIISGPAEEHIGKLRRRPTMIARKLVIDEHYEVKEKERQSPR